MDIKFTLKEIEEMIVETKNYIYEYTKSIEELDKLIDELSQSWVSKESKTYEYFYSQYKENYFKLIDMQQMMNKFYDKLENKKQYLIETSREIKKNFE